MPFWPGFQRRNANRWRNGTPGYSYMVFHVAMDIYGLTNCYCWFPRRYSRVQLRPSTVVSCPGVRGGQLKTTGEHVRYGLSRALSGTGLFSEPYSCSRYIFRIIHMHMQYDAMYKSLNIYLETRVTPALEPKHGLFLSTQRSNGCQNLISLPPGYAPC